MITQGQVEKWLWRFCYDDGMDADVWHPDEIAARLTQLLSAAETMAQWDRKALENARNRAYGKAWYLLESDIGAIRTELSNLRIEAGGAITGGGEMNLRHKLATRRMR